jgi:PhnB protein
MKTVNVYLNFPGSSEEAFSFYRSIFGGEFLSFQRFRETPEAPTLPESEKDKLMHISLPIGKNSLLMATDAVGVHGEQLKVGNNFHLSVEAESKEEADRILAALSKGGKVSMPLQDTFWGAYFGMLVDRFDIQWMVSYTPGQGS